MRVDDGGRSEILPIGPEHGAGGGTRGTQNALGCIIVTLTVLDRLVTFTHRIVIIRDKKGHDLTVRLKKWFHVNNHVFFDRQPLDWLYDNGLGGIKVLQQDFACQTVESVNAHGIGATNTVGAGTTESQRTIELPFNFV